MVNRYLPKNTQKNRVRAYRFTDILLLVLVVSAGIVWFLNKEEPEPTPLEMKVDSLTRSLESLDAQQQGTVDYLIQQTEDIDEKFEELAIKVKR